MMEMYVSTFNYPFAPDESKIPLDQHVCRSSGASKNEHKVFERIVVYGCRQGDVRAVRNDHAVRH